MSSPTRTARSSTDGWPSKWAVVKNGDPITIDAEKRQLNLDIPAAELKKRLKAWKSPKPRYTRGVLAKYASAVTSASLGAVTDMNLKL